MKRIALLLCAVMAVWALILALAVPSLAAAFPYVAVAAAFAVLGCIIVDQPES